MTSPIPLPVVPPKWAVDAVMTAAQAAGWPPGRPAFECALQLLCHGVSVAQAVAMFERCERVKQ